MPASPRPEVVQEEQTHELAEGVKRIVPVRTRGQAISLRVQNLRAEPARSRDRLGRLALLTPSCGGLCADRKEKRVTHGSDRSEPGYQEQLDRNVPIREGLLQNSARHGDRHAMPLTKVSALGDPFGSIECASLWLVGTGGRTQR